MRGLVTIGGRQYVTLTAAAKIAGLTRQALVRHLPSIENVPIPEEEGDGNRGYLLDLEALKEWNRAPRRPGRPRAARERVAV